MRTEDRRKSPRFSALPSLAAFAIAALASACATTEKGQVNRLKDAEPVNDTAASLDESTVTWTSKKGNIYLNDHVFHMKGVNWFGLETPGTWLLGLEHRSLASILDLLEANGVNSIRVPVSAQRSLDLGFVPSQQNFKDDADLVGKPWSAVLKKLIEKAAERGITIMLDMHTIKPGDNLSTGLWYTQEFSKDNFREAWKILLTEFGGHWNIWGLDLKNELHEATWAARKESDWNTEVERLVPYLNQAVPGFKGIYVVQGIWHGQVGDRDFGGYHDANANRVVVYNANGYGAPNFWDYWWGGNLLGVKEFPLQFPAEVSERIAYTTHFYGPAVWPIWYYNNSDVIAGGLDVYNNPDRLNQVLESQYSYIESSTGRALIIGEWGGRNGKITRDMGAGTPMATYDDSIVISQVAEWFPKNCMADAMWWAINPESSDTGGLLKPGYEEVETEKFAAMAKMMPDPTMISYDRDRRQVRVVKPGSFRSDAQCQH